jgi:hypothetical protein
MVELLKESKDFKGLAPTGRRLNGWKQYRGKACGVSGVLFGGPIRKVSLGPEGLSANKAFQSVA